MQGNIPLTSYAENLDTARRSAVPWASQVSLRSDEEAYEVQRLGASLRMLRGASPRGYKVGLTSKAIRDQFGIASPDRGILMDEDLIANRSVILTSLAMPFRIELELALRVGADTDAEKLDIAGLSFDAAYVVFEVLQARQGRWEGTVRESIADNAALSKVVVGGEVPVLSMESLDQTLLELKRNGVSMGEAQVADVDGGVQGSVEWLHRAITAQDPPIKGGDLLLIGAPMQALTVEVGDTFVGLCNGDPLVEATFR